MKAAAQKIGAMPLPSVEGICIDPARIKEFWPIAAPSIRSAMIRGGDSYSFGGVERSVFTGKALLWLAWDGARVLAAAITELVLVDGVKTCRLIAVAGRGFSRYSHILERLEQFARDEGCSRMNICGRPGWQRVLPDYRVKQIVLEKEL